MAIGHKGMTNFEQGLGFSGLGLGAGALSGIGGGLTGHQGRWSQQPTYAPQQQGALNWLTQQGMQNADFGPIEQQYKNQFQSETIPGLAERFTSMGGGQRSSAFQGALGSAGSDLSSHLAALRSQFGMQQLGMGLRPQFENIYTPARPGMLQGAAGGLMSLLPLLGMMDSGGGGLLASLFGARGGLYGNDYK